MTHFKILKSKISVFQQTTCYFIFIYTLAPNVGRTTALKLNCSTVPNVLKSPYSSLDISILCVCVCACVWATQTTQLKGLWPGPTQSRFGSVRFGVQFVEFAAMTSKIYAPWPFAKPNNLSETLFPKSTRERTAMGERGVRWVADNWQNGGRGHSVCKRSLLRGGGVGVDVGVGTKKRQPKHLMCA